MSEVKVIDALTIDDQLYYVCQTSYSTVLLARPEQLKFLDPKY